MSYAIDKIRKQPEFDKELCASFYNKHVIKFIRRDEFE